jgi:hypothetical protein
MVAVLMTISMARWMELEDIPDVVTAAMIFGALSALAWPMGGPV